MLSEMPQHEISQCRADNMCTIVATMHAIIPDDGFDVTFQIPDKACRVIDRGDHIESSMNHQRRACDARSIF